jgi:hypothetical protein
MIYIGIVSILKVAALAFFQGSSKYVDMAGMASCDYHIMSNSTFA